MGQGRVRLDWNWRWRWSLRHINGVNYTKPIDNSWEGIDINNFFASWFYNCRYASTFVLLLACSQEIPAFLASRPDDIEKNHVLWSFLYLACHNNTYVLRNVVKYLGFLSSQHLPFFVIHSCRFFGTSLCFGRFKQVFWRQITHWLHLNEQNLNYRY